MSTRKWKMPTWMEPYRAYLAEGERAEELMNGKRATVFENAPLALIQMGKEAEVQLLIKLYKADFLRQRPTPEKERGKP